MSVINELTKKLDKKVIEGKMIHCKAHVPSTPPRLNESEHEKDKEEENKKQAEPGTRSDIPGLSSPPMSKNQKKKQKKKLKKIESPAKVANLKTSDFLLTKNSGKKASSLPITTAEVDDFAFSDDELSNDENETNKGQYNSYSTPSKLSDFIADEVPVLNLPNKRYRTSPDENTENKKTRANSNGSLRERLSI